MLLLYYKTKTTQKLWSFRIELTTPKVRELTDTEIREISRTIYGFKNLFFVTFCSFVLYVYDSLFFFIPLERSGFWVFVILNIVQLVYSCLQAASWKKSQNRSAGLEHAPEQKFVTIYIMIIERAMLKTMWLAQEHATEIS